MHMLLLNRHMRIWPTPCGGIEKEKAKSDLSNKIPLLASFERSFYGLFLTKAALLPFLLTPASKQAASLLIKLAELHIYEEARKGPTLLLSSASAYEEGGLIHRQQYILKISKASPNYWTGIWYGKPYSFSTILGHDHESMQRHIFFITISTDSKY